MSRAMVYKAKIWPSKRFGYRYYIYEELVEGPPNPFYLPKRFPWAPTWKSATRKTINKMKKYEARDKEREEFERWIRG